MMIDMIMPLYGTLQSLPHSFALSCAYTHRIFGNPALQSLPHSFAHSCANTHMDYWQSSFKYCAFNKCQSNKRDEIKSFSFQKLRQSLQMNASIRQSMAQDGGDSVSIVGNLVFSIINIDICYRLLL